MKKKLSSFCFSLLIFMVSINTYAAKPCECGTQAGGSVTSYSVGDGEGCCTGTVEGTIGTIYYYEPDEGTTFTLVGTEQISATAAQDRCCENT